MIRSNPIKRRSIFVVIGKQDKHLDNYLEYFSARSDNQKFLTYNRPFDESIIDSNGQHYDFKVPTSDYDGLWQSAVKTKTLCPDLKNLCDH